MSLQHCSPAVCIMSRAAVLGCWCATDDTAMERRFTFLKKRKKFFSAISFYISEADGAGTDAENSPAT
jgi:hypothetical protein